MHALVLYYDAWPLREPARAIARAVADGLGVRATAMDRRPHLGSYDLIVLVLPAAAQLDPRLALLACEGDMRGKAVALATDLPEALLAPWCTLMARVGGAHLHVHSLSLGAWLPPFDDADRLARARSWGEQLAESFPAPAYPRGEAGTRKMS